MEDIMKRTILNNLIIAATLITSLAGIPSTADARQFTPAATLEEAEKVAKATYNFIAYKSPAFYGTKVEKHQRIGRLNQINKEVHRLEAAYGITLPRVNILHVTDTNRGFYNYRRGEIVFSTRKLEHTLRHEFAHVIDRRLEITGRNWHNLVRTMKQQYQFSPSDYALTNTEEYWAEAFAYFTAPDYGKNGQRFPEELERFIMNVIQQLRTINAGQITCEC
jgi:hypothetical protein